MRERGFKTVMSNAETSGGKGDWLSLAHTWRMTIPGDDNISINAQQNRIQA